MDAMARAGVDSPIQRCLDDLYAKYAGTRDGAVATYIPELAKADPDWFAICVATTDGYVYEVGDSRQPFTIQSISKPFTYGLALEDRGRDAVLQRIDVEPTGDAFNSISLAPETGRPLNPMINAGAIAATSLVAGHSAEDRLNRIVAVFSLYAGRALTIDGAVYESERSTGHRNRAIGHMLRNFDILTEDPEPALDLYFKQCSVAVDCRDLSVMAATLANAGTNPLTGERAVRHDLVDSMLSVMATCGMYDYAGQWVYWVGMPAKSGVSGGILAVLPGQLGIGVFSPRLDARGNSVRGVAVCRELSREMGLHFLRIPRLSRSALRKTYDLAAISSKRMRTQRERERLDALGHRAVVYELQGDLGFSTVETLIRRIVERSAGLDFAIVDFTRAGDVELSAAAVFLDLLVRFAASGRQLVLANAHGQRRLLRFLEERLTQEQGCRLRTFADVDSALEWCENRLLAGEPSPDARPPQVPLAQHDLCRGLDAAKLLRLEGMLEARSFRAGELIIRRGEPADSIYLLTRGAVSVTLELPNGRHKRLATLSAGMTFGELAVIDRAARGADLRADTVVECYVLPITALDALSETDPRTKITILENLLRHASRTVNRLNDEVAALAE
ncbi:MAG: hypothetical protein H6Q33_2575 [Deltaproteobacteria bacterium]|nr:hypothetical protein [Deltaproteobacteria bacterium]